MSKKLKTSRPIILAEVHGSDVKAEIEVCSVGPWVDLLVDRGAEGLSFAFRLSPAEACQIADLLARAATFAVMERDKETREEQDRG